VNVPGKVIPEQTNCPLSIPTKSFQEAKKTRPRAQCFWAVSAGVYLLFLLGFCTIGAPTLGRCIAVNIRRMSDKNQRNEYFWSIRWIDLVRGL
jgi:hypothetical protein